MLLLLQHYFSLAPQTPAEVAKRRALQEAAQRIMSVAFRPLAEEVTLAPLSDPQAPERAGPSFEIYSDVALSPYPEARWPILLERLEDAVAGCVELGRHASGLPRSGETLAISAAISPRRRRRLMLSIGFSGWAMCRLATDPDPYDDPRGVSGYMRAYAGEPDLDEVIRFQAPPFRRANMQPIGVTVVSVTLDGVADPTYPLLGSGVDLLDNPVFEGRNGVIAEDGVEPIAPFHLAVRQGTASFSRATVLSNPQSPYREFNAINFAVDAGFIERATGIASLTGVWQQRLQSLEAMTAQASDEGLCLPAAERRVGLVALALATSPCVWSAWCWSMSHQGRSGAPRPC